jgi:restriction system protein
MSRKKVGNTKLFDALAGLTIIGLGILLLATSDFVLTIKALFLALVLLICVVVLLYLRRRRMLLSSGIAEIDKMSGTMFELLLLETFRKSGYRGKTTQAYGDYGADLLLVKDDEKFVVQAKRWNQKIGVKAVQEIVAAIKHY